MPPTPLKPEGGPRAISSPFMRAARWTPTQGREALRGDAILRGRPRARLVRWITHSTYSEETHIDYPVSLQ